MSDQSTAAEFLREQIERTRGLRAAWHQNPDRAAERMLLRTWQSARLTRTHGEFLLDPDYRPAAEFFLNEVYSVKETAERDTEIERAYPIIARTMPERALRSIGAALELDGLTEMLDEQLLERLPRQRGKGVELTESTYASAYRRCDNYALREHQIDLIAQLGSHLVELVARPLLAKTLRAMRIPARLAGFGTLQTFLEQGFSAFRRMPDAHRFVATIERRERQILERIYAGHPRPFEVEPPGSG